MRNHLFLIVSAMAGCGGLAPPQTGEPSFSQTQVRFATDGTPTVTVVRRTRAQQLAEIAARRATLNRGETGIGRSQSALTVDGGCADSSMWMFDQVNLAGNEICFVNSGDTDSGALHDYIRFLPWPPFVFFWDGAVKSYWAGSQWGILRGHQVPPPPPGDFDLCDEFFSPNQRVDVAGVCAQTSYWLYFAGPPSPPPT